jgi:hypothetical protein
MIRDRKLRSVTLNDIFVTQGHGLTVS